MFLDLDDLFDAAEAELEEKRQSEKEEREEQARLEAVRQAKLAAAEAERLRIEEEKEAKQREEWAAIKVDTERTAKELAEKRAVCPRDFSRRTRNPAWAHLLCEHTRRSTLRSTWCFG